MLGLEETGSGPSSERTLGKEGGRNILSRCLGKKPGRSEVKVFLQVSANSSSGHRAGGEDPGGPWEPLESPHPRTGKQSPGETGGLIVAYLVMK